MMKRTLIYFFEVWGDFAGQVLWAFAVSGIGINKFSQSNPISWLVLVIPIGLIFAAYGEWQIIRKGWKPWQRARQWQKEEAMKNYGWMTFAFIFAAYLVPLYVVVRLIVMSD